MNVIPILKKKFPEGSIGPIDGECINFCHAIVDFPSIGDTLDQKKKFVQANGIIAANINEVARGFRIGDVVITTEGSAGHGFIVADMDDTRLLAAESNYRLDKKVRYGRVVSKNDPKIYGILRRPKFKLDVGQCEVNYNVFINNQGKWGLSFLDIIHSVVLEWTDKKLKINFFPLITKCENWWYETQANPIDGMFFKIIAKAYLEEKVKPLAFTNAHKPADVFAFVVRPDQWEGEAFGRQNLTELGWCDSTAKPAQIQLCSSEFALSPWYDGMRQVSHGLIHELGHFLNYLNGDDDKTHFFDNPASKQIDKIFSNLDLNKVKINL